MGQGLCFRLTSAIWFNSRLRQAYRARPLPDQDAKTMLTGKMETLLVHLCAGKGQYNDSLQTADLTSGLSAAGSTKKRLTETMADNPCKFVIKTSQHSHWILS